MLHEPTAGELVKQMLGDARPPFRRTAAWLMGRLARPEFAECLRRAEDDQDAGVRQAVQRALEVFGTLPPSAPPGEPAAKEPVSPPKKEEKPPQPKPKEKEPIRVPRFDGKYIRGI